MFSRKLLELYPEQLKLTASCKLLKPRYGFNDKSIWNILPFTVLTFLFSSASSTLLAGLFPHVVSQQRSPQWPLRFPRLQHFCTWTCSRRDTRATSAALKRLPCLCCSAALSCRRCISTFPCPSQCISACNVLFPSCGLHQSTVCNAYPAVKPGSYYYFLIYFRSQIFVPACLSSPSFVTSFFFFLLSWIFFKHGFISLSLFFSLHTQLCSWSFLSAGTRGSPVKLMEELMRECRNAGDCYF